MEILRSRSDSRREYLNENESAYLLPIDKLEKERLSFQHSIIRCTVTDRWPFLIPNDDFELLSGDRVLDCGTGGGDWLLDAARFFLLQGKPSGGPVEFKGIDISKKLFPNAKKSLTSTAVNISFEEISVLSLPPQWTSTYSLVHQRYLIAALRASEWEIAVSEIYRVLKPSGWLILVEAGTIVAGPHTKTLLSTIGMLFKSKKLLLDCARRLPEIVRSGTNTPSDVGASRPRFYEDTIGTKIYQIPLGAATRSNSEEKELASDAARNFLWMFRSMRLPLSSFSMPGRMAIEEFDELMNYVEKEWHETPDSYVEVVVIHAKKV